MSKKKQTATQAEIRRRERLLEKEEKKMRNSFRRHLLSLGGDIIGVTGIIAGAADALDEKEG